MIAPVGASRAQDSAGLGRLARRVVDRLGGRHSAGLGLDVDAGDAEIERWFLAATLFGTRITAQMAERTFGVPASAGVSWIGQARHIPQGTSIAYLDEGGYARYDALTVARLQGLSEIIGERYDGRAAVIGQRHTTYPALRGDLDVLPGWGPVTIQLFLRELRGVWPGAQPPLDACAEHAAASASLAPGQTRMFPASPSSPPNLTPIPGTSKADWSGSPSRITTGEWAPAQAGTVASC